MPTPLPTVLTDAYIAVNGTALSAWANKVSLTDTADQVETTGFSTAGYRSYIAGLKKAEAAVTFFQDFQNSGIDQTLQPFYASGGTFVLEVRPTSAAASSTNPKYTMTSRLYEWSPLNGGVGDASSVDVTFENAGTAGLVRGTS
jgi:hypothetical protein